MESFLKKISLFPKGLKYKIMIAFALMSVIPLLICVWLATTYIFPNIYLFLGLSLGNISFILAISIFISILGLCVTKQMIDPVVQISEDARIIAEGDVSREIKVKSEDEVGELSASLNAMTRRIRENIDELKAYSERTKLINIEINKKVLALSSLLQIGNLISSSENIEVIMDFIAQKLLDVEGVAVSVVMALDIEGKTYNVMASSGVSNDKLKLLNIEEDEAAPVIEILDKDNPSKAKGLAGRFLSGLGMKNVAIFPILVGNWQRGMIVVGNKEENFAFKDEDKELLKVFIKQATIAVENDLLIKKAKELSVKDELTGLYNENYIRARLSEEIERACMYQRPCGYLLIDIDDFKSFHDKLGEKKAEYLLKAFGEFLKKSVTEVDRAARLSVDRFAVVMPEKNKKQLAAAAEELRKKIETGFSDAIRMPGRITVSIGVTENPIDGSIAEELMEKAEKLIKNAKSLGKNRVAI